MKLNIKAYDAYCQLEKFEINDIAADYKDFGEKYDRSKSTAPDYGCGDMHFESKFPTEDVLKGYGITESEYWEICDELDCLSFGRCSWCV